MGVNGEPPTAYVGLGSNVGDRSEYIRRAIELLETVPGVEVTDVSPVYETEPWGYLPQPAFLNAVVALRTALGPRQLLIVLKIIERQLGREKTMRWGPRRIDLDLLICGEARVARRDLVVPHAGLPARAFVLVPLKDVFPDYRAPTGDSIDQLLARLGTSGIRRL